MSALTIRLFGKFDVQCSEQTMPALEPHKVQELLCYLLLHRDHSHPREVLAGLLWPDSPAAQSRKCLPGPVEAARYPGLCDQSCQ